MSDPANNQTVREGARHWAGKMLSSGRFAILQYSLVVFLVFSIAALVMLMVATDEKVIQAAIGLLSFAQGVITMTVGYYLRGGSSETQ